MHDLINFSLFLAATFTGLTAMMLMNSIYFAADFTRSCIRPIQKRLLFSFSCVLAICVALIHCRLSGF